MQKLGMRQMDCDTGNWSEIIQRGCPGATLALGNGWDLSALMKCTADGSVSISQCVAGDCASGLR
jgi:hypothetical protein